MWTFEKQAAQKGYKFIAGVDEAGRGPLAGPVVSAAVILPFDFTSDQEIKDSKKLTPLRREKLYPIIMQKALSVGIGIVEHDIIDRINILQASLKSMKIAVNKLSQIPDYLLIDGKFKIDSKKHQQAIIRGDSQSISIAAASIIAKVTRDQIMKQLHEEYPEYGFDKNKGYPTKFHKQAIVCILFFLHYQNFYIILDVACNVSTLLHYYITHATSLLHISYSI